MDPADPPGDPAAGDPAAGDTDPAGNSTGSERRCTGQDPLLFRQALQTLWSTRELWQLREEAWRGFAALDDPLTGLLDVLEGSQAWQRKGPSLEAWVVCELHRWLQARPLPASAQHSSRLQQLQARAVRVLARSPPSLVEPLVSIFQLQDADRSPLLTHIHQLHQEGKFKEAVVLGSRLKLQPALDVEKMCTPLLLQDRVSLVERYVAGFPDLQRRLLALLDSWCRPGFDIGVVARQHPQVTSRLERLSPRVLSRRVLSQLERLGLDPALCPNAATQQRLAALRYLCYKRFVERSMSQENWVDHVQGLVGREEWPQEAVVQLLASPGNEAVAAQCALGLSVPEEQLPATVAAELRRLELQERVARAPLEDRKGDYYQLPIAREDIHFLASWEDLARHEEVLLQPGQVVGVDMEWRPSFGTGGRPQASVMQLAVEGRVFLLDLPVLSRPAGGQVSKAFSGLVSRLLSDPSITKLGYGLAGDLRSLGASCPALAHVEKQLRGGLDLLRVHRQMRVVNMPAGGTYESRGLRGLSLLVQQVLGKPLDKTQQLSNWDRRPLSEGQLVYAAADAYCLLEVHQALSREPASFSLSEDLARSLQPGCSERPGAREPPRLQEASALPWQVPVAEREDTTPEVPARAFRVVCDNMLQGLARSLRCLGADVRVLGTNEDHRRAAEARTCTRTCEIRTEAPVRPEAVAPPPWFPCSPFLLPPGPSSAPASAICLWHSWQRAFRGTPPESAPATGPLPGFFALAASTAAWSCAVARQEGRIILTSGLPYHKLRDQVGAGRCLWVDCSLKARQQAKAVLRHFNVRVTHADIFSRCQACNCDQYLKVSKDTMKQLVRLSSCPEGPSITRDEATQSEDIQEAGSAPEEAPGGCTYDPPCRWLEAADLRAGAPATLASGTRLQLAGVPEGVLRRPGLRHFYCCSGCGKVFWEGSHLCRVTSQFSQILSSASSSWKQS
ncbi:exonuclease mut-7 homolog isoform X5 [Prionailurus viverrinus]|nr:exonuclease mut-7 homolog isoform X5 [Prionailurus viverrinus]XP_047686547.1 exonuclease mut-7 homolog isoform X5 [Prionailurus viverrinus]XP_047686549.1 exonuclease mut-7 homolog isoform X5 [Prionailurus viverrinus]XP_047686550.1 exonuclease mut-7 homolog isoform X5 [Prionailurus viverrinus]XP_047686551.1 exonuclease mut-7 homolog isoform X5 [Prionailurus viverrinus]